MNEERADKNLIRPAFTRMHDEKKDDTFTVKLNKEGTERQLLNKCKNILEQKKDSTALKQLAWIGAKVLLEPKIEYILAMLFKNKRNNKRLGIVEF